MMARRGVMGLLAGAATLVLGGCGLFGGNTYNVLVTVEVETPEGIKTGSSVMEISAYRSAALTSGETRGGGGLRGEAVVVELDDGPLVMTLKPDSGANRLASAITVALDPSAADGLDAYMAAVSRLGRFFSDAEAELPRQDWPVFVEFGDISDPNTLSRVSPVESGVTRIMLETVSLDVTSTIHARLPWLANRSAYRTAEDNPFTNSLPPEIGYLERTGR
ncbi:MAG: hypothetical protein JKY78_12075 [Hyphomonas sp.]|nr:hypothetical protein [Hyphomonas sp.]